MKKIFLFLSILMFALTGIFFACDADRYADLKITYNIKYYGSEQKITKNEGEDFYRINWGERFIVDAKVSCSSDISTALNFTAVNGDSINSIGSPSNTSNGSKQIFEAVAPSYDDMLAIKVESVETGRHAAYIFIKVVLPVEEIDLADKLGVTYGAPVNLVGSDAMKFIDASNVYETNEKGVNFTLNTYTDLEKNIYTLETRENGDYYFTKAEQEIDAFRIQDNNLIVLSQEIEGSVNVTANSEKFKNLVLPEGEVDPETVREYAADQRLTDTENISIVKPISLDDISFVGGQVVFKDYDSNGTKDSKLTASLYLNSLDSYTINGKQYYYNYEDVNFTVYTSANVNVYANVGNMFVDGEELVSDVNVVKVAEPGTLTLNKIYGQESDVIGYETTIKVSANGGSGFAYVDFIVEYTDFSNKIEYSFSKLYSEYLQSLDVDVYESLNENAKHTKLVFESTAIPAEIILEQDDRKLAELEQIKIYDSYGTYNGFSEYGTKIDVKLALSSGTMSSKIKDENKLVKVYIYNSSNNDPTAYFDIYDSLKNRIILSKETIESVDRYYFELDLARVADTYFYIKAATDVINQSFTFEFENVLASKITSFTNEQIEPNTDYTTLTNLNSKIYVETVKGIEDVLVVTRIEGEENPFKALDSKNLDTESDYTKLILQANEGSTFNKNQGTLIAYMVNKYVIDQISITVDEEYLQIFTLDSASYSSFFEEGYNAEELDFKGALSIVGKKIGTTQIVFSAENGFKVFVEVEIVNAFTSAKIDLEQGYGKDIISQNELNIYGKDPYASAKINGSFNIVYKIAPNASGVFGVDYETSNPDVVTINKTTGMVKTVSKGITEVTVTFSYYKFEIVGDFYQWSTAEEEKSFVLEVYIPATTIKLNKSVVNVYDYESLGYEYKDQSTVAINVIVYPVNANIANDNSNVTFILSNNNNNLIGKNGVYTAFLNANQEKATVYVTVSVFEYGKTAILNCVVNIYKAPQVEEINFSVFEGSTQRKVSEAPLDSQGHEVFSFSTQNDKTLTFNTSIVPPERNVLVDDLVVVIFKANQEDRELTEVDSTRDYAGINYKALSNQNSVIINGQDSFELKIGTTYSGYFYVVIFARDNMNTATTGDVFVKILVQITDGTQANPYVIETVNQLIDINNSPTKHYVLGANLNLGSISNWTPIKNFTGSLNGFNPIIGRQGTFFEIAGLKINTVQSENVGLFETISNSPSTLGAVMNLTLKVASINLVNYAVPGSVASLDVNIGTIAGKNEGVIVNCAVEINSFRVALINKNANVGGIVGVNGSGEGGVAGGIFNFSNNSKNATADFNLNLTDTSNNNIMNMKVNIPQGDNVSYLSANPVNGKIFVQDKAVTLNEEEEIIDPGLYVNAGGIAGVNNSGYINGIYGIYNLVDEVANASAEAGESNVSYLTNYQSQGIDVSININYGTFAEVFNVVNGSTALGGVVGLLKGGQISNVSAEGHIGMYDFDAKTLKGAYNNVGGIVGKSINIEGSQSLIENISTSVKLRANNNVGGVVGYAENTVVNLARVEAYENVKNNDQTLIVGSTNVGGIIGESFSSDVSRSYSFSFVDDFNSDYIAYGDIYSVTDNAYVGAIIGYAFSSIENKNVAITSSYSTFNIVVDGANSLASGMIGAVLVDNEPILTDVAYIGVIDNAHIGTEGSIAQTSFAYNIAKVDESISVNNDANIGGYYYYYILAYGDKENIESGANKNCLYVKSSYVAGSDVPTASSFYNSLQLLVVNVYQESASGYEEAELKLRVPTYTRKTLTNDYTCYLIRLIPTEISVSANGQTVVKDEEHNSLILKFNNAEYNKNYYYTYVDDSGVQNIIINFAELKDEFELSELFTVVPTPAVKGNLNILVSSSDNNNLQITDKGNLIIKRTGNYQLTFVVKENVSATAIVKVLVIKNFDKLLISNLPTYKTSLFDNDEESSYKVRIKNEVNIFNLFAEYVADATGKVVYETVEGKNLVAISNVNNYTLEYVVDFKGPENSSYIPAAADQYDITATAIKFSEIGSYRVSLKVKFVLNGINYIIENDEWKFYFNAYSGATNITFSADEIWLQGSEIYNTLKIDLTSDVGDFENLYLIVSDKANKLEYEYTYNKDDGKTTLITYDVSKGERESIDGAIYPFNILVSHNKDDKQGDIYHYNATISITNEFKTVETARNYVLKAYDGNGKLVNSPAVLDLYIAPQSLNGLTTIHYAYTQQVSQLTNIANTEADGSEDEKNVNYSYSFSGEPKNTVVAGNEGLFVIDLYPFYANITSISIESSLGIESGHSLQFVQLVKIKGNSGYYYIYAPLTQSTGNNGIYLNKYSYIPEDVATISYESDLTSEIVYDESNIDKKLSYGFVEEDDKNSSEVARLYVKTVAPSNLKEEEEIKIIVRVKYKVVNEEGILEEKEYLVNSELGEPKPYEHKLVVESMPGFSMRVTHNGADRDVIAFTGPDAPADWLEIIPIVEEGYSYERITASWKRDKGDPSSSTDYVELRPNNVLILGSKAKPGDKITISVIVKINYEGYTESRIYSKEITVVDVVIEEVTIKDLDADNNLKITVSTSRQLKAQIVGFGTEEALVAAENAISRTVTYKGNLNYFWNAKSKQTGEQYISIEAVDGLPFVINKVSISNDVNNIVVDSSFIGAGPSEIETKLESLSKIMVLEGSTESGVVDMQLKISYVYNPDGGAIVFVPNTFDTYYKVEKYFQVVVTEDSNEDNPTPIYDEAGLKAMASSNMGSYILMNDITIERHTALNANFASFDGNNKIITINSFEYSTDIIGTQGDHTINLGLFSTVSEETIIKNVIVAYPADKEEPMNLRGYSTINFGGIAAINNGVITNCDVISVLSTENPVLTEYVKNATYTINIQTATVIGTGDSAKPVEANIGGLVGINGAQSAEKAFITNSRVGRESVEILTVYDSEATVVYKNLYRKTAPITIFRVQGSASVGGFVAVNKGTISTSYAKNIQVEAESNATSYDIKTAGFVVTNTGFVYGSFAAGWEEENSTTDDYLDEISANRKLGGGLYSNGFIGGFVYENQSYIEDCYSNINVSGSLIFAADTTYIKTAKASNSDFEEPSKAAGGFVYKSMEGSYITTSYSMSKIPSGKYNTHGAFEGRDNSPDETFPRDEKGSIENCYFMLEKVEDFNYDHERARMLSDDPVIDLEGEESVAGTNEFINKSSFNNFSFDNSITDFNGYNGESTGGVWAIYKQVGGTNGYPELISANTIAISCRVINVTKTNESDTNKYYYTYVDGYDLGSYLNPYIISNFAQYNNIFKDAIGSDVSLNENIPTKFTGNIRLIKNIDFAASQQVYSTSIEYTSLINLTSIFDGNYLAMYNINLLDEATGKKSFGLFRDIYYAAVKNVTLAFTNIDARETVAVGGLAGSIVNSNISNVTLISSTETTEVKGKNYVGALAGIVISNDTKNTYTVSNIKSNLAVVGTGSSKSESPSAITTSFFIWEKIKPISSASGLSEINSNLRLHKLPEDYYYGGGVIGFADLHQVKENVNDLELKTPNIYNVHVGKFIPNTILSESNVNYDRIVSVQSDYAGGLFGFVGAQTFVECAEFLAVQENEDHYIAAKQIAGGITAVNFGKLSQCYVSFDKETVLELNDKIVDYVNREENVKTSLNKTLFYLDTYQPKYIGGIAGINVGNGTSLGAGNIVDCYNRVDVRNPYAKGVGGIVGGTYIGQISNVYSTASLMGDLTDENTKIGGIIGKIFENGNEGYFADYYGNGSDYEIISLFNIVALNIWNTEDFDALYEFVNSKGGYVGALYGKYTNEVSEGILEEDGLIRITGFIFVQNYAMRDYTDPSISEYESDDVFDISCLEDGTYFELWGVHAEGSPNHDPYLNSHLCEGASKESLIYPNDFRALMSGTEFGGVSTLREVYFPSSKWSRVIWNYDDVNLLPILEYGYESSVIRIYTANQFIEKLKEGNSSGKLYVIMNDIDFDGVEIDPIATTFRGQLYGNNVTYDGFTRKPILFNVDIGSEEERMKTGIFAILQNSIGATYSNFNIVLRNYNVTFSDSLESETVASVLIGSATNSTINNVNIYSSLNDYVNRENMLDYKFGDGTYFTSGDSKIEKKFIATQGYYIDGVNKEISSFYGQTINGQEINGYIKLATLLSTDTRTTEEGGFSNQYIFTYNASTNKYEIVSKYDGKEGKYILKADLTEQELESAKPITISKAKTTIKETGEEVDGILTNGSTVGLFIGAGSLSYISNSSVNVDINVRYTKQSATANGIKYVGSLIGRNIGEMRYVISTSTINVTRAYDEDTSKPDVDELYVGSIVGNIQGVIRFAYVKDNALVIGTDEKPIVARSGASGAFIGGVVGSIDRYTTVNEAIVGGANFLYITDCDIDAFVKGKSSIAGAIGQNSFTVGDLYVKQSPNALGTNKQKSITVTINDPNSNPTVAGLIAVNKSTFISNAYNNSSIYAVLGKYNTISMGGIIGIADSDAEINNVISDAKEIKITRNTTQSGGSLGIVNIGGVLAQASGIGATVKLNNIFSTVNIISEQERVMNIGGAIGTCTNLVVSNVAILGNITLNRGKGDGTEIVGVTNKSTYYYAQTHNIGGLVGECSLGFAQDIESAGTIVLSTIKDYAIAQKLNVNIGPVIGTNNKMVTTKSKTYFCEAIALVADNGYNEFFVNIDQTKLLTNKDNNFDNIYKNAIFKNTTFVVDSSADVYSNYYTNYYNIRAEKPAYISGSKLSPKNYNGTLDANTHYVLTSDLNVALVSNGENWILNGQGNTIKTNGPVINNVSSGSALVGVLTSGNQTVSGGALVKENKGFVFACGSSGKISASGVSGLVQTNYGVINSCFSIANIFGSGAGLVLTNGNSEYVGNIYSSYYTGTITPVATDAIIAGIATINTNGVISNSYTMGDLDVTESKFSGVQTYPIANSEGLYNTYNTYYDYLCYSGNGNEGITKNQAETLAITTLDAKEFGLISEKGVYVWSSTLAGDEGGLNYVSVENLLKGSWLRPGDEQSLIALFAKSEEGSKYNIKDIKLDTSWFNYGYTTNNLTNIIVNTEDDDDLENVVSYLQMLYTGNGLEDVENVGKASPKLSYNTFVDQPYRIKHAGMLDILVRSNNAGDIQFKYYLFVKNIDFVKYSGTTYWSESWDKNLTVFVGDLNGKQYDFEQKKYTTTIFKVINMYSSYGLLRALPKIDNIDNSDATTVRNLIFEDCFSKTGLIAGYQHTGKIENIQFGSTSGNYVVNGDYSGLISKTGVSLTSAKYDNTSFNEATIKSIMFKTGDTTTPFISLGDAKFAGGVVGFMQGGIIARTNTFTNLYVTAVDTASTNSSYVGGIVGIMQGGEISGESASKPWAITGINAFASLKGSDVGAQSYVGAITGYAGVAASGKANIKFLAVQTQTTGYYCVAGVAGIVEGAIVSDCSYQGSFTVGYRYIHNNGFIESTEVNTDKVVIGGIASYLTDSGSIINSKWEVASNTSVSVSVSFVAEGSNYVAVGGIVGEMDAGDISSSAFVTDVSVSSNNAQARVGGIVGYMMQGLIKGTSSASGTVKVDSLKYAVAGGIVGYMTNGVLEGTITSSASVDGVDAAGGIVGEIKAYDESEIIIKASATAGIIQTSSITSKAGGIVGYISCMANSVSDGNLVTLTGCKTGTNLSVGSSNALYSGGIVGAIFSKNNKNDNIFIVGAVNEATVKAQTFASATASDKGVVSGASFAGGIAGYIRYARIEGSTSKGNVGTDSSASPFIAGGIVGYVELGVIDSCSTTGGTVSSQRISGGIVGFSHGVLIEGDIGNAATVSNMTPGGISGGVFGVMAASTNIASAGNITNTGNIGSSNSFIAGGVVGYYKNNSSKIIKNVTSSGSVTSAQGSFVKLIDITSAYNAEKDIFSLQSNSTLFDATPGDAAGGIVGYAGGTLTVYDVQTSSTTGAIAGYTNAGGIIGSTDDLSIRITNVTNVKSVSAEKHAGGIIGKTPSSIKFVTKLGEGEENPDGIEFNKIVNGSESISPTITSKDVAGGIAGLVSGVGKFGHSEETTQSIINYGSIGNETTVYAGGLIGTLTSGNIYSGKNVGSVKSNKYAGGLIGNLTGGNIYESCVVAMGNNTISANEYAGGVVGYAESGTTYVNVTSAKFGASNYVGGLVGYLSSSAKAVGKVSCNVTGGTLATGGAVGFLDGGSIQDVTRGKDAEGNDIVFTVDASGITVKSSKYAGGLVGYMDAGTIAAGKGGNPEGSTASGGLVGYVTNGGNLTGGVGGNATSSSSPYNGGAVGEMDNGQITKDDVKGGNAKNGTSNGGLVGHLITGTISKGKGGETSGGTNAGGMVGLMEGGSVSGGTGGQTSSATNAGGIVGKNVGGQVTGGTGGKVSGNQYVGGVVGRMEDGQVSGGSNANTVSGGTANGGVVGYLSGGTVSGGSGSTVNNGYAGGVVGYMVGGAVSGGGSSSVSGGTAGGSVGYLGGGTVSGGGSSSVSGTTAGGVVGEAQGGVISGGWADGVSGTNKAGGTVGSLSGATVTGGGVGAGSVSGGTVGGVVGYMTSGSVSAGNVKANVLGTVAGGIVGQTTSQVGIGFSQFSGTVEASSNDSGGGILGKGAATLSGGTMSGTVKIGCGVVGLLTGNLYLSGSLTISGTIPDSAGVITTTNSKAIGSTNSVTVSVSSAKTALVVTNNGTIKGIKVSGSFDLSGRTMGNFGAIAESNSGTIDTCANGVSLTASIGNLGGICGSNSSGGVIYNCTNSGTISKTKTGGCVGGIAGYNAGSVGGSSCKNSGSIIATTSGTSDAGQSMFPSTGTPTTKAGGVVGKNLGTAVGDNSGNITNIATYTSSETSASIIDYRGQVAGENDGGTVKKLPIHTKFEIAGKAPEPVPGPEKYYVIGFHVGSGWDKWEAAPELTFRFGVYDSNPNQTFASTGSISNITNVYKSGVTCSTNSVIEDKIYDILEEKYPETSNSYSYFGRSCWTTNGSAWFGEGQWYYGWYAWKGYSFTISPDTQEPKEDSDLQDCGGVIPATTAEGEYQTQNGHELYALKALYELCGPCDGVSASVSSSASIDANGQSPSSGSAGTQSGFSGGGPVGGGPSGPPSTPPISGGSTAITNELSGKFLEAYNKTGTLSDAENQLVTTALKIAQSRATYNNFQYGYANSRGTFGSWTDGSGYNCYTNSNSGSNWYRISGISYRMSGSTTYWYAPDVLNAVNTGSWWGTDCCGFIRFATLVATGTQGAAYPTKNSLNTNTIRPGDVIFCQGYDSDHIIMYIYHSGSSFCYVDQSGGLKYGTFNNSSSYTDTKGRTYRYMYSYV